MTKKAEKPLLGQIVLRVDDEDRTAIEKLAAAQHRSMANYLRCLVKDHIEATRPNMVA
ncbi:putative HicB family RNase H-like nuclease [Bradyrhizobium japonicum]|uniref:hypothetical protein n=1 Tax=Bradyrhizobium japonicum TaxID=375 RepID=UPI0022274232|nr:hypothetical protein [Bradyrhizobium japonicum]MCW2218312.1 putative HicB family RNase H-like nuclease [Bradyrhizobium japonicum]MCW2342926.1 putative HicB family RNase H-like nuclease [Bradyrhizobium japonicum]